MSISIRNLFIHFVLFAQAILMPHSSYAVKPTSTPIVFSPRIDMGQEVKAGMVFSRKKMIRNINRELLKRVIVQKIVIFTGISLMTGFIISLGATLGYDIGYKYFFGFMGLSLGYALSFDLTYKNTARIDSLRLLKGHLEEIGFHQNLFQAKRYKGFIEPLLLRSRVEE